LNIKYAIAGVVAYFSDTNFYNYLMKLFNATEENESFRRTYKKSEDVDWKAEFEKAERQREWEKWLEKHPQHEDNRTDSKLIKENPNHKDEIFKVVNRTFEEQINRIRSKLTGKQLEKFDKVLTSEDLIELQTLADDNRSIDDIKAVKAANRSHINFLSEIKRKSSKISMKEGFNTENNDNKLDDTMNLFD